MSDSGTARAGHYLRHTAYLKTQELPVFKRAYRILYFPNESEAAVEVLRFGTAIVMNPSRIEATTTLRLNQAIARRVVA